MKRQALLVVSFCLVLTFGMPGPGFSDSKKQKKHGKDEYKGNKHREPVEYREKGGPPPWAPAHGYRAKHKSQGGREVVTEAQPAYVVPFGIDLGRCNREVLGSVAGGALGGLAGSTVGKGTGRTAAIIGGTVLGVLVGGSIGRAMDQVDQSCVGQVLEHGFDAKPVRWQNPDASQSYTVSPVQTFKDSRGRYCREYSTTATIGGRKQQVYGTACRQPDGSWELVK